MLNDAAAGRADPPGIAAARLHAPPAAVLRRWLADNAQEIGALLALLVVGAAFAHLSPNFLRWSNILNIGLQISIIAILGFGVTIVIISGGIDLSLGSVMALVGIVTASVLTSATPSLPLAVAAGIGTGALTGLVNGVNIVLFRIPAFIATLGMLSIARGLALTVTNAVPIFGLPDGFLFLGTGFLWGIPVPIYVMLAICAALSLVLGRTEFGRHVYAIGGNEEATRLSGINVDLQKLKIYVLCGVVTGIAGVLFTARLGTGQPTAGTGYELDAITAAILGGTNLFGGSGKLLGTLIGAVFMGVINTGLNMLNVNSYTQLVIKGVIILLAVGISAFRHHRAQR